jgi:hypothetical protein
MSRPALAAFTLTIDVTWIDPEEVSPHAVVARLLNDLAETVYAIGCRSDPALSGHIRYSDGGPENDRHVGAWGFR